MPTFPTESAMLARLLATLTASSPSGEIVSEIDFNAAKHEMLGKINVVEQNLYLLGREVTKETNALIGIYQAAESGSYAEAMTHDQLNRLLDLKKMAEDLLSLSLAERFSRSEKKFEQMAILNGGLIAGVMKSHKSDTEGSNLLSRLFGKIGLNLSNMRMGWRD